MSPREASGASCFPEFRGRLGVLGSGQIKPGCNEASLCVRCIVCRNQPRKDVRAMYADCTLIVEGAVDQEWQVDTLEQEVHLADCLDKEQAKEGWVGELEVLWHSHAKLGEGVECMCAQYEPAWPVKYRWGREGRVSQDAMALEAFEAQLRGEA